MWDNWGHLKHSAPGGKRVYMRKCKQPQQSPQPGEEEIEHLLQEQSSKASQAPVWLPVTGISGLVGGELGTECDQSRSVLPCLVTPHTGWEGWCLSSFPRQDTISLEGM